MMRQERVQHGQQFVCKAKFELVKRMSKIDFLSLKKKIIKKKGNLIENQRKKR